MSTKDNSMKKQYKKPEIKRVELRPEEAVLGFCKTSALSGPLQATCTTPANCGTPGS